MTLWFENKHKLSQKLASPITPSDLIVYVLAKRQAFNDSFQSLFNVYLIAKKNFIIILHLLLLIITFQQRRL